MAKILNTATAVNTGGLPEVSDGKQAYRVMQGVEWVNGEKLKGRTEIRLTDKEAEYDLALERIVRADLTAVLTGNADGGN